MQSNQTRIHLFALVDPPFFRLGLEAWVRSTEDLVWVGSAESWRAALLRLAELPCDLVLFAPGPDEGLAATFVDRATRRAGARVVALVADPTSREAAALVRAGAAACVDRTCPPTELARVIRTVHRTGRFVAGALVDRLIAPHAPPAHAQLSPREGEVFRRIIAGRAPSAIARDLGVSASTVSTHLSHIRRKLAVESVAGVVAYAARAGLLQAAG
ncbi:MAG: response regulator transcription factor [Myxococcales bacterium]|nr:response regulator transcription factor [Myxococcales bacterium]MCB9543714.1 response regulator transcription factor [Myxococcales bacterium]